ncbi:beta-1,6-N-acetylglucosaminyltransferase [Roseomonas sp. F4]
MRDCAFIVLAHRAPLVCRRLLRRLRRHGDVFLHVDAKVDQAPFLEVEADELPGRLHLADQRFDIRWGAFSMIDTTLAMLAQARGMRDYHRFTLISGDTYPIQSDTMLASFLASDTDAIGLRSGVHDERRSRLERVFLPDTQLGALKGPLTQRFLVPGDIPQLREAMELLPTRAAFVARTNYYIGSQWWSLTAATLARILAHLEADPEFLRQFRFSAVPDESFFQTAFMAAAEKPERRDLGPVHVRWDLSPRPFVFLQATQFQELRASKRPFARKFADESMELLDLLDSDAEATQPPTQ